VPGREVDSPPGRELLRVITSHGPFRESHSPSRKSRGSAEAIGPPAEDASLSAEHFGSPICSRPLYRSSIGAKAKQRLPTRLERRARELVLFWMQFTGREHLDSRSSSAVSFTVCAWPSVRDGETNGRASPLAFVGIGPGDGTSGF
jgi:hypothetical protein